MKTRGLAVLLVFVLIIIIILINLFLFSVADLGRYRADVVENKVKKFYDYQEKGNFYDRNGRVLTQNIDVCAVYVDRKRTVFTKYDLPKNQCPITKNTMAELLAHTMDKDPKEVYSLIYESKKPLNRLPVDNICIYKDLDIKYLEKVNGLNYRGIYAEKRKMRYYPEGTLASRVLGATNYEGRPIEGLEKTLEKYTQGQTGEFMAERDRNNKPVLASRKYCLNGKGQPIVKKDGDNVYLTIDTNIQFYAEKALNNMASLYHPQTAMCVVMDPKNSEILAMANYPKYDPNNHKNYENGKCKNFAVENMYEPGSTLKTFTVAMGVEQGAEANSVFGKCTNVIFFKHTPLKCDHGPHGICTPKNIIEKSCNIGAWYVTKKYGKEKLYDYLNRFGILGRPGDEFSYEARGRIYNSPDKWVEVDAANYSFGQGMLTSCLAMCNGYCAIASGGIYHTPKIIKEIKNQQGKTVRETKKDPGKRIITEHTAKVMTDCLAACVNEGTGKPAAIEGIQTVGKTGSAQIFENGTYKSGAYLVSFMGFAPAENPDLVIAVMVEKPKGSTYGAVVAAPVWREVMEKSLKYRKKL